jgi:hypothetical protein
MPKGATFPDIEPSEPLAVRFTTLWYSSDMVKQWQSNVMFHTYYLQLKRAIESFPRMTLNTLHRFRPLANFRAERHFIYITARRDENKEELQSYYKLTEEDMGEITKELPVEFLVPVEQTELFDPDLIGSPMVTREEYNRPCSAKKKKMKEEVQEINNASENTIADSPRGGGGSDEVNQEEEGEEDKQEKGEVTLPKDPLTEAETSKKIKVSPKKPLARKKSRANKPQL